MEEKEIKIKINQPKNFENIHHSLELVDALESVKKAQKKIEFYKETFVESFIKTADEVLEYIPDNHLDKYSLCEGYIENFNKQENLFGSINHFSEEVQKEIKKVREKRCEKPAELIERMREEDDKYLETLKITNCKSLADKLKWINSTQKVFIVDTINKKIELLWGMEKPTEMASIYLKEASFNNGIKKELEGEYVYATCSYYYKYYYTVPTHDAIFISTSRGNGYYNKTERHLSSKEVCLVHKFNIRNNTYEGIDFNGFIKDDEKPPKRDYSFRNTFNS